MPSHYMGTDHAKISVQVTREFYDRWLTLLGQDHKQSDILRAIMHKWVEDEENKRTIQKQFRTDENG